MDSISSGAIQAIPSGDTAAVNNPPADQNAAVPGDTNGDGIVNGADDFNGTVVFAPGSSAAPIQSSDFVVYQKVAVPVTGTGLPYDLGFVSRVARSDAAAVLSQFGFVIYKGRPYYKMNNLMKEFV